MANDKHSELTNEFVRRARDAAGDNLLSVILYGSAADGEFHPDYSDLNLLCVLRDVSFPAVTSLMDVVKWWRGKKHHPPLVLSANEVRASASVFSIEFIDMKSRYRVLTGEDVLQKLEIPLVGHLFQLRYELREKLTLLRQHMLLAGTKEKHLWEIMLHSVSSFTTLFRHVLLEMGEQERKHSREAVAELARRMNFDPAPFVQLMDVRAGRLDRKQMSAFDLAGRYLGGIEKVADAVDTMQNQARNS
jgi:predicted nucleotidyltransferase